MQWLAPARSVQSKRGAAARCGVGRGHRVLYTHASGMAAL